MKKMTVIMILLAVGFCGLAADTAKAGGTVVLTISADIGAGTWEAFANVNSGTNAGIASFIIDVTGTGGATVTGSTNESPTGYKNPPDPGDWGFADRSDGTNGVGIYGLQNTSYGDTNDPAKDDKILQEIGVAAGSRQSDWPSELVEWAANVRLASGTFTYTGVGQLHVALGDGYFNLLDEVDGTLWEGPGGVTTLAVSSVTGGSVAVPEPATMTALALGGLALLRRRRK